MEFIVQYLQLMHCHKNPDVLHTNTAIAIQSLQHYGFISIETADMLTESESLFLDLQSILRLTAGDMITPHTNMPDAIKDELVRLFDGSSFTDIEEKLITTQQKIDDLFSTYIRSVSNEEGNIN